MRLILILLLFAVPAFAARTPAFVNEITNEATFNSMASDSGGSVRAGKVVKFLIDNRNNPNGKVYFINGQYCEGRECPVKWAALHFDFAQRKLPNFHVEKREFENSVYYVNELPKKKFIAGRLQTFEIEKGGETKTFYGVWFFERDVIQEESIQYAVNIIKNAFRIPSSQLAFVSYSQVQTVERVRPWFDENKIAVYDVEEILANLKVLPLSFGEAWGILRAFPKDPDGLEPTEIPVFAQLPLDLAVVAGTISTAFQDVGSHVNLKSKERGTPNVVVREASGIEELKRLDGQPVHLRVTPNGYSVEVSDMATVLKKYEQKISRSWQKARGDLGGDLLDFDKMCPQKLPGACLALNAQYGGKASQLGFLTHAKVLGEGSEARKRFGYRLSPLGFGIPFRFYREFVDYNSSINPEFKQDLDTLINSETSERGLTPLPVAEKRALVEKIRENFLRAKFPAGIHEAIEKKILELKAQVNTLYPGEDLNKLKIRSSANVEDIPGFNGAGLHDSFSASIKKSSLEASNGICRIVPDNDDESETKMDVKPKSFGCAIKGVFASLWNLRAVRERSFQRFHHRTAMMGLAVLPAYKFRKAATPEIDIAANAVVITRVLNTTNVYGYQMSSQPGNVLVTNPPPGSQAELATMTFQLRTEPAITILRHAKPDPNRDELADPVMSTKTMRDITYIAREVEEAYCAANRNYFRLRPCSEVSNSAKKPRALDMELKVFNNGEILFKQFRQFTGN